MAKSTHPRVLARGTRENVSSAIPMPRVIAYAPGLWEDFVDGELAGHAIVQVCRSFGAVVATLLEDPPPRPQVLVIDFDALSALDLVALCSLRERGWFGEIVALGDIDAELARAANIGHVVRPPCRSGALRTALAVADASSRHDEVTVPIPCL